MILVAKSDRPSSDTSPRGLRKSLVGDAALAELQALKLRKFSNLHQALVGDLGAAQIEPAKLGHIFEQLESFVAAAPANHPQPPALGRFDPLDRGAPCFQVTDYLARGRYSNRNGAGTRPARIAAVTQSKLRLRSTTASTHILGRGRVPEHDRGRESRRYALQASMRPGSAGGGKSTRCVSETGMPREDGEHLGGAAPDAQSARASAMPLKDSLIAATALQYQLTVRPAT